MKNIIRISALIIACFSFSFLTAYSLKDLSKDSEYTICDYNGKIAVFENGEKNPKEIFDVYSSSLPKEEYEKVLSGIEISDNEELQKMIEAYIS